MYYTKKEVLDFITELHDNNKGDMKFLSNHEDEMRNIVNGEQMAGIFWFRKLSEGEEASEQVKALGFKMEGKSFVKIDEDIYTDDRFAIDAYQAQKEQKTVSEIITERREAAKKDLEEFDISSLEELDLKEIFNTDNNE